MPLYCPVCNEEWLIYNNLCPTCKKIKHTMSIVGKERFIKAIEKLFILTEEKTNKILDKEKEKTGLGIITRAKAKEFSS